jgi:hypothetical protein
MSNVHSAGETLHDEPELPVIVGEVRVPEVGTSAWPWPQTAVGRDTEEGDRWDGLS